MGSTLNAIARAYLERERQRVGIPQQEQAAAESETVVALRRITAARALQELALAPEEQESQGRLRDAQIRNLDEPNRNPPAPRTPHYTTDRTGVVRAITPNEAGGGFTTNEIGPYGQPQRDPSGSGSDGGFAANPFLVRDAQGNDRLAVRIKGGGLQFVDDIGGTAVSPGPTAEQRNTEAQSLAVEPAFDLVEKSLDSLEKASAGLSGSVAGFFPGTDSNYAKTRFIDQAKALLGAIVARQAGEGSRLSDDDRRSYSQAATIVNNQLLLPGGVEEARGRLADARQLIADVIRRRRMRGVVSGADPGAAPGGAPVEFIRDATGKLVRKQ